MKSHVLHTVAVVFLVRLQGKFEIDHSWEWKGLQFLYCPFCGGDAQFWALPNLTRHKNTTGAFIENRRHGFLNQPFGKRHRVVPPTFHTIRVYAFSFKRLGNFSQKSPHIRKYLVPRFRLPFWSPPELSENMYFQGVSIKILGATPPQKHHVISPWMIPYNNR